MGMFDNISVSDTLPYSQEMKDLGLDLNNHSWQTKDLCNCLGQYFIQGGRLFEQRYKVNEFIEGDPNSKDIFGKIGHLKKEDPYLEPVYHHGEIYFYDSIQDVQDKWDCWVEFKAIFTNGGLDRYQLVKFEKRDNAERKEMDRAWLEEIKIARSKWYNKYIFFTRPYRWFSRNIWYNTLQSVGNFLIRLSYKL